MGKIVKCFKTLIVVGYIVVLVVIGMYKFPNQNITFQVRTESDSQAYSLSTEELNNFYSQQCSNGITEYIINYPLIEEKTIKEIVFFRKYKTITVGKIASAEIWQYATIEKDQIRFNQNFCEIARDISESLLLERLILAEYVLVFVLGAWIILNSIEEKYDPNNKTNHGPIYEIRRFGKELVKYREYIFYAARADLNAEVANSYLNRLWWVLEPFFNMLVYVIVFGRVMGNSIKNYATYVFSALIMWNYFNHIINYSVKCIRFNRDIVTKIYMPKYVLLLTNMVLNFIKMLFSLIVLVVMILIFKVHIGTNIIWMLSAYLLMLVLCFGFGMIFMHYGVFVDDLSYAIGILITMLMFLSGIFYDVMTTLPSPLNVILFALNPVAMFVDTMRQALLYNTIANVPLIGSWMLLGIMIMYIGLHIVYKNENSYVKVI